jgi:hypothetical protein
MSLLVKLPTYLPEAEKLQNHDIFNLDASNKIPKAMKGERGADVGASATAGAGGKPERRLGAKPTRSLVKGTFDRGIGAKATRTIGGSGGGGGGGGGGGILARLTKAANTTPAPSEAKPANQQRQAPVNCLGQGETSVDFFKQMEQNLKKKTQSDEMGRLTETEAGPTNVYESTGCTCMSDGREDQTKEDDTYIHRQSHPRHDVAEPHLEITNRSRNVHEEHIQLGARPRSS